MRNRFLLVFCCLFLICGSVAAEESKLDSFDEWSEQFSSSLKNSDSVESGPVEENTGTVTEQNEKLKPRPLDISRSAAAQAPKKMSMPPAQDLVEMDMGEDNELVGISSTDGRAAIERLERRLASLEKTVRFLEDRLRNLDRTVDDMRRRS